MSCNKVYITLLVTSSTMAYYDSIRRLPQYVRAGAGVVSLCAILAGCSSKTVQVKVTEVAAPTEKPVVAVVRMPEMPPEPEFKPLYSLSSNAESKSPVGPYTREMLAVKQVPLESNVSATNVVASEDNATTWTDYVLLGTAGAGFLFALYFALKPRKKEEDSPAQ